MLRLWPERFVAGVFPGAGWLCRAGRGKVSSFAGETAMTQLVPHGLDLLLCQQTWPALAGIELLVSDGLARVIHLPWQERLTSDAHRSAYARACFDQAGMGVDDKWLVHASYRHFRGTGLAYALPRSLVSDIRGHLGKHKLRLLSVLPLSAAAYWHNRTALWRGRSVLVLEQHDRFNALLFDGKKCAGFHVQPGANLPAEAAQRMLSHVDAVFPTVQRIQWWSLHDDAGIDAGLIKKQFGQAQIERLHKTCWS